ncbi:MAG: FCD domain-containing protein [Pseudomonadota bacterium]
MPRRRPPSRSYQAVAALREALAPERLDPQGRLPGPAALMERHGLDKRSLRRAFEVLEAEGQIWRGAGGAWFASEPAPDPAPPPVREAAEPEADALLEARLAIEPGLAAKAARRAVPRDVARLRGIAARVAAAADADGLAVWDAAFHRVIAQTAGNSWLVQAYMALDARRAAFAPEALAARRTPDEAAWSDAIAQEHRALIDAIAAGDPEAAEAAMTAHLVAAQAREAKAIAASPPDAEDRARG